MCWVHVSLPKACTLDVTAASVSEHTITKSLAIKSASTVCLLSQLLVLPTNDSNALCDFVL